jgi:ABC-2 type transport system permease protein
MTHYLSDLAAMTGRCLKHVFRSMDTIITAGLMPIAMMLLFVFVLGGAITSGTSGYGNYVNYQLPGILLITVATGISYTAFRLFQDVQGGLFERFHTLPIAPSSVLWGHVLTSLVSTLISLVLVVAVALLCGFRPQAGILGWLATIGILLLFTLALTWLAIIVGLKAKSADGAGALSYPLIFLPFISSAFVPTASMPGPLAAFAQYQPVTPIVNALRSLLNNQPIGPDLWIALAWIIAIILIAYLLALRAYRHPAQP